MSQPKERLYYFDKQKQQDLRNYKYHYCLSIENNRVFTINIYSTKELDDTISMTKTEFTKLFPFDLSDIRKVFEQLKTNDNFYKPLSHNVKMFLFKKEIVKNIWAISSVCMIQGRNQSTMEDMSQYANIMKKDDNEIMIFELEGLRSYCRIIF